MPSTPGRIVTEIASQWNTGFTADVSFTPTDTVSGWRIEFTFEGEIDSIWNARIVSHVGNNYVVRHEAYNRDVSGGDTVSFGFQASGSPDTLSLVGDTNPPVSPDILAADASAKEGDPEQSSTDFGGSIIGALSTDGNRIVDENGEGVIIEAVNWFGMETHSFAPHGLWSRNWQDMMDQIKEVGFNAIRLPFCLAAVLDDTATPNGIDAALNPDLVGLGPLEIMDKIIDYAEQIGVGILLDNHRSEPGPGPNGNGLWFDGEYTQADWIKAWRVLADRYADNPAVIGADLANEPHNAEWNKWAAAAERAGNAVLEEAPDWLVVVEGVGDYHGDTYWWGGDLRGVADRPVVLSTDDKLVYSPHDYPHSVFPQTWFTDGSDLTEVFREHWGYIHEEEIAPILVGEFGSKLEDPLDLPWAAAIVSYLSGDYNADGTVEPGDNPMNFAWWSWNPNSGDTGGILQDDWQTLRQNAVDLLAPLLDGPAGGGGGDTVSFTVTLSEAASATTIVTYETVDGTARAGKDYAAKSGALTFAPGETSKTVNVAVLPDRRAEGDETFYLDLEGPGGKARATGTIVDDDGGGTPSVSARKVNVHEDDGRAVVTFKLSEASDTNVRVAFRTRDIDAQNGQDYVEKRGWIAFRAGVEEKRVAIDLIDDNVVESNEAFAIALGPTRGDLTVGSRFARVRIRDDDEPSVALAQHDTSSSDSSDLGLLA